MGVPVPEEGWSLQCTWPSEVSSLLGRFSEAV